MICRPQKWATTSLKSQDRFWRSLGRPHFHVELFWQFENNNYDSCWMTTSCSHTALRHLHQVFISFSTGPQMPNKNRDVAQVKDITDKQGLTKPVTFQKEKHMDLICLHWFARSDQPNTIFHLTVTYNCSHQPQTHQDTSLWVQWQKSAGPSEAYW